MVHAAARAMVGNEKTTLFREDRWIGGFRLCELAPRIYNRVPKRVRQSKLVAEAIRNNDWTGDIGTKLAPEALEEFLKLWPRIADVQLADDVEDSIRWMWEQNGKFSARLAYAAPFMGWEVSATVLDVG
ncbi:uncharacterized protein [Aegilops tauschii subsp. strangulata]|uniref:uncharacterized protein n=1 Tax=Aegilops tauschii subsp. strangulata TaxID=200361 RepID=UPI00098A94BD|nr:uncharacterized protein LOC109785224 [Aegilops tauschii subsp. strangulata]